MNTTIDTASNAPTLTPVEASTMRIRASETALSPPTAGSTLFLAQHYEAARMLALFVELLGNAEIELEPAVSTVSA